ncbi:MAG TPA: glycine betaine ABC transporter substrate-binding protein [Rubrobacter sp.]|nr:glycine betaine ABC transporter substrate-binding protein [Rubrobacter sp.]
MDLKGKLTRREMLKLSGGVLAGASLLGVAGCGSSGGGSGSSASKTLTLGDIGWTENIAINNLTRIVMGDELGYDVVIKGPLDVGPLYQGVASGDLDAFQDTWMPNHKVYLNKPQIEPRVELLPKPWYEGKTEYGLTVLSYMKGITSIADLDKAGTNEITGIEPGAAFMPVIEKDVIPAYNLDMKLVTSSTAGMLAELERKNAAKEPIVFTGWSPHWMNLKYDIVYLDDPKDAQGAFDNSSTVTSTVNADLKDNDPTAYTFLKSIRLDETQVNQIEAEMNKAGSGNEEKGVRNWLKDNSQVVKPWVEAAKSAS